MRLYCKYLCIFNTKGFLLVYTKRLILFESCFFLFVNVFMMAKWIPLWPFFTYTIQWSHILEYDDVLSLSRCPWINYPRVTKAAAEARAPNICSKGIYRLEKIPSVLFTNISSWKIKMCFCYNLLLQFRC